MVSLGGSERIAEEYLIKIFEALFCAKHRDFLPGNFCTLCRILQVRVPIASLDAVQKQYRNRALTLGQIKNDDF